MTNQLESSFSIANAGQAEAWNGSEGQHWAAHAERYERSSRRTWAHLLDSGVIASSDAVLDIGCGTGKSTRDAARVAADGSALGVDLSAPMLERAREKSRTEGLANVSFLQADAQVHAFGPHAFDIAISSYGAMFFNDPVAAFTNIGRALRRGGGLALLAWRSLGSNEWISEVRSALAVGRQLPEPPPDAPTPFSLADPDRVRSTLTAAGFDHLGFEQIDEPIEFGSDADDAYAFMRSLGIVDGLTQSLSETDRTQALANLRQTVVAHAGAAGVLFGSSSWLITARHP